MCDLLAIRVQLIGYIPIVVSDGKEGVEKANAERPDLILLDMMMPVMAGWEAARILRHPGNNRTPSSDDLKACLDAD
jgi:CheY-like chemotaxis protein